MLSDLQSEIYIWARGGLFILATYHLIIYFQNKKKLYLYYSLYMFGLLVYYIQHIFPEAEVKYIYHYLNYTIPFLAYAAYIEFGRLLLETNIRTPKFDIYLCFSKKAFLGLAKIFLFIQLFLGYEFQLILLKFLVPILTILMFIVTFFLLKIKLPAAKYFFIGTFIYILCVNIAMVQVLYVKKEFFIERGINLFVFSYAGVFIQATVLATTIGLTIKRIEQKNKNSEVRLAFKYKELEELKMTALQSQMNPHFLFNSLNSINNFVLKSDIEKASDYITKFSKLIRVILKSSSSLTIPFSEEIKILSLYVKLEQIRINGGFEYKTNIDNNINLKAIEVPPLFLQPYIENSIWHGLTHVKGEKKIVLNIFKREENIVCEVIDNGIGINAAQKKIDTNINRRKFFGTQATENRIRLLYKNTQVKINIFDISDKKSTGTKVEMIFPYLNK